MVWPQNPTTLRDIPLVVSGSKDMLISGFEVATPGVEQQLCAFIRGAHDELELITQGDEQKEKTLGQLLFDLAYRSAAYATPSEVISLRHDIDTMERHI